MLIVDIDFCIDYYTSHPPFDSASSVAIAAVGTICLAVQYGEVRRRDSLERERDALIPPSQGVILFFFLRKYPDFLRTSMWFGLALYFVSLFASSFATQVCTAAFSASYSEAHDLAS